VDAHGQSHDLSNISIIQAMSWFELAGTRTKVRQINQMLVGHY
jgi:hypothetical protein